MNKQIAFSSPLPAPPLKSIDKQKTCGRCKVFSTASPPAAAQIPSWEREYEIERGLVSTSYETATIESVTSAGEGFLRIAVDTSVTGTSLGYQSVGQFLFLKPWGDEDGLIEPCCFTRPPGDGTMMEFFVPEVSAVGEAALAGEMLELSNVMGDGFSAHQKSRAYIEAECVMAVCIEQFCWPVLLALSEEKRRPQVFVLAESDGPFGKAVAKWENEGDGRRQAQCFCDENSLLARFRHAVASERNAVVLLSGDKILCESAAEIVRSLSDGRKLVTVVP